MSVCILAVILGCACEETDADVEVFTGERDIPDASRARIPANTIPHECPPFAPPSSVPPVTSTFEAVASESLAFPPAAAGGDPTGDWSVTEIRVQIAQGESGFVNTDASTITGTGWVAIHDGSIRVVLDLALAIIAGEVPLPNAVTHLRSEGRYTVRDNQLLVELTCVEGFVAPVAGGTPSPLGAQYERAPVTVFEVDGDTATAVTTFAGDLTNQRITVNLRRL